MLIEQTKVTKQKMKTQTKKAAAEICFCFGTLGVEYFMNLEPEENNNSVNKTKEVASKRWFFFNKMNKARNQIIINY